MHSGVYYWRKFEIIGATQINNTKNAAPTEWKVCTNYNTIVHITIRNIDRHFAKDARAFSEHLGALPPISATVNEKCILNFINYVPAIAAADLDQLDVIFFQLQYLNSLPHNEKLRVQLYTLHHDYSGNILEFIDNILRQYYIVHIGRPREEFAGMTLFDLRAIFEKALKC